MKGPFLDLFINSVTFIAHLNLFRSITINIRGAEIKESYKFLTNYGPQNKAITPKWGQTWMNLAFESLKDDRGGPSAGHCLVDNKHSVIFSTLKFKHIILNRQAVGILNFIDENK